MAGDERVVTARGRAVPRIGLGTWQLHGRAARDGVADALALGYRHLDTASMYGNEEEVGAGLRASGVDRDEVWITTKVWRTDLAPARLRASAEASRRRLGVERIDLLLVHWPDGAGTWRAGLEELAALREEGVIAELGVSNFDASLLEEALVRAPVFADQVEHHVGRRQDALEGLAADRDLVLTAYSPLGQGGLLRDPVLNEVAAAHGVSPAQVALRWLVEQDRWTAIPRSSSHERRGEDLDVFSFALSAEERARLERVVAP